MIDNESWRWIWVAATLLLGFGEIVTAGFFMLPFAIGAAVAAVLAFVGVEPIIQLLVFIGVSVVGLLVLQRFVRRADEHQPTMGSNRMVGQQGRVIEAIDPATGIGRVRVETEDWRATADGHDTLVEGTPVRVTGIRGTRLVVEPIE
jgi:membrane protein implicated in regulation of membrane protease activity